MTNTACTDRGVGTLLNPPGSSVFVIKVISGLIIALDSQPMCSTSFNCVSANQVKGLVVFSFSVCYKKLNQWLHGVKRFTCLI